MNLATGMIKLGLGIAGAGVILLILLICLPIAAWLLVSASTLFLIGC